MVKISFLGDIMCEPLMFKASKQGNSYDFTGVFENVEELLSESDYVVGNLETPLAGREAKYVNELFSFNAPDEFAEACKKAGINYLSTANNHCMDRGLDGLKRTVRTLENLGIDHGGTYEDAGPERDPFITTIDETKVAIVPFTYGTNYSSHHRELQDKRYVDLLRPDTESVYLKGADQSIIGKVKKVIFSPLKKETKATIKKILGMTYNTARKDDSLDEETCKPYFDNLKEQLIKAKDEADIVVFYPHVGGQFNLEPGRFTEYTVEKGIEYGADAVIASHPHIVQKAEIRDGRPAFYSVGNFSMSPNSVYLLHEHLPEYGLAVHLYIENKKIINTTFSILKIVETKDKMLSVYPVDILPKIESLEDDVNHIYKSVTGKILEDHVIRHEYEL